MNATNAAPAATASSACPMDGIDTPHHHQPHEVVKWLRGQAIRFNGGLDLIDIYERDGFNPIRGYSVESEQMKPNDGEATLSRVFKREDQARIFCVNHKPRLSLSCIVPLYAAPKSAPAKEQQ